MDQVKLGRDRGHKPTLSSLKASASTAREGRSARCDIMHAMRRQISKQSRAQDSRKTVLEK
jgi:hypothetical protein